jgi:hypothetical protein
LRNQLPTKHKSHIFKASPVNNKIHTYTPNIYPSKRDIPDRESANIITIAIYQCYRGEFLEKRHNKEQEL